MNLHAQNSTVLSPGATRVLLEHVFADPIQNTLVGILALPVLYILVNEFVRSKARIPHIKGPRGLPLIGNIWDIRVNAAEKYRQWAKRHGDVYQIMLGNIPVVVINSAAAAKTIFGSNAQALSSRPELYTFHKVGFCCV
jgi:3-hydroxyphenylacetate 6-hydroxylase